eukprot:20167-Heterococcus_DN1.PRE.2
MTALHHAVHLGSARSAQLLLQRGAHVNGTDVRGQSVLLFAVKGGSAECVQLLLEAGVDVHLNSARGGTVL